MTSVVMPDRVPPPPSQSTMDAPTAQPKTNKSAKRRSGMKKPFTNLDRRMTVEKGIVDELLLVCGVIGTTVNEGSDLVPVADCLNWLQDLQRALRRDDDLYRPISMLIGKWKVVQQKLLPLIMTCQYDSSIVLTVVKILVILTKPLSDNTKRAGRMAIDSKKGMAKEQMRLRENALEQSNMLMGYKKAIVYHASHHGKNKKGTGLISILVSLLAEPLSRAGAARTDTDHLTIELVLHLIRNLLAAEPLMTEGSKETKNLHDELISLCDRELVMEILLVIGQEMEARENAQYNLLVMELLHHIFKGYDPLACARPAVERKPGSVAAAAAAPQYTHNVVASTTGSLSSKLKLERSKMRSLAGSRHAHFGGTWMSKRLDGKTSYFGASRPEKDSFVAAPKRKNRKTEPFIGSNRTTLAHSRHTSSIDDGPATKRAQKAIYSFCERFVENCYGPVMKSLKNEFRRDSVRLEDSDKSVFFRLVWFFSQWWRLSRKKDGPILGNLIFTMDVFTFNLVLNATDSYHDRKILPRLAQTVALYSEMTHLLYDMYKSKDNTENNMAVGLMERLFYAAEPLDRLPKLLQRWTHGTSTREYLCDLSELCYMTLKLLDENASACRKLRGQPQAKGKANDTIEKMKLNASQFDVSSYFMKKILSNQLVSTFTHLLNNYTLNAAQVNHRIMALFLRLSKFQISSPPEDDSDMPQTLFTFNSVSLEPLLYNIQLLAVLEQILNDGDIRSDPSFEALITFASNLIHNFASAAEKNPLLFVEILFKHNSPGKFCENVTNSYVSEELRMIAERDALLEEQRQIIDGEDDDEDFEEGAAPSLNRMIRRINNTNNNTRGDDDDDDDEELVFTGDNQVEGLAAPVPPKSKESDNSSRSTNSSKDDNVANESVSSAPASAEEGQIPAEVLLDDDGDKPIACENDENPASKIAGDKHSRSSEDVAKHDDDKEEETSHNSKRARVEEPTTNSDDPVADGNSSDEAEATFEDELTKPGTDPSLVQDGNADAAEDNVVAAKLVQ